MRGHKIQHRQSSLDSMRTAQPQANSVGSLSNQPDAILAPRLHLYCFRAAPLPSAAMRLLIVEDETKTARYLKRGLSESGFAVDIASDGSAGLHLTQTCDYALVILDIMLPQLDGWAVLRDLRCSGKLTPVI